MRFLVLALVLCASTGAVLAQIPSPDTSLPAAKPPATVAPKPGAPGETGVQPTKGDDRDVIEASEKWLKLLDAGQMGAAWDLSAPSLKSAVTRKDWIDGISAARKPFGKVASRKAEKFARSHELPGLPQGDYALLLFDTRFANGKQAQEHLTCVLDAGEVWRVSGYFIR
jgi:hypothetical protein